MDIILRIVYTILVLGFLIFVHELGHFTAAKIFKVQINEFSLGFGPMLIGVKKRRFLHIFQKKEKEPADDEPIPFDGTKYALRLLPIGGFVSMEGENEESKNPAAFINKPAWQKLIIVISGVLMNFIVAFIITAVLVCAQPTPSTTVGEFSSDASISQQSGLQLDDTIVKINNTKIGNFVDITSACQDSIVSEGTETSADVTVIRNGEEVLLTNVRLPLVYLSTGERATPENLEENEGQQRFMTIDFKVYRKDINALTLFPETFKELGSYISLMYKTFYQLLTGKLSLNYVSGPVGTSGIISDAASQGIFSLLYIVSMISINLAVFNLLPFPALDGGRAVFLLFELIFRRKVNQKVEGAIHAVGMILLLGLMVVITFKDIFFPIG